MYISKWEEKYRCIINIRVQVYQFLCSTPYSLSFPQNVLSVVFNFKEHLWNMKQ